MNINYQHKIPPNELKPYFLNVNSLNNFPGTVSASRAQMFGSHLSQKLVISGCNQRYLLTGMEREFGKSTFSIKAPCNMKVLKVIDRYRDNIGPDSISLNPQTIVIYEDVDTKTVGMLDIPTFCSYHQYFGFSYKPTPNMSLLSKDRVIDKDTIFADSPAIGEHGAYMFGVQLNVAYMSHPAVSEDGAVVSRDALPKLMYKTFEKRVAEYGAKKFPLNMHGTHTMFKAFPDIGEIVRADGILMMFRTFDPLLAPVEQSIYDVSEPDFMFDEKIFAPPGGKIIDIKVFRENGKQASLPELMEKQALKYANAAMHFHNEILDIAKRMERNKFELEPEFHRQAFESLGYVDDSSVSKIQKEYRTQPLDDVRIEFTIEYEILPDVGNKITDCYGGKAVICHIAEPHEMPVDEAGNRADVIMDAIATFNRMIPGRLYEQYYNCCSRDVLKRLSSLLGIPLDERYPKVHLTNIAENRPDIFNQAMDYLLGYYKIVAPLQYEWIRVLDTEGRVHHMASVLKDFIYLHIPTDNEPELVEAVVALEEKYAPTYGPVSYIGFSGNRVTTKKPVRIGSVYFMLLEKTGNDWSSVSSARLHHFGFLAPVGRSDKHGEPIRGQPVRANGEAEMRIFRSTIGPLATAEIMDRNGSPTSHRALVETLFLSPTPTNIPVGVDRSQFPFGSAKPLQLLEHITTCSGWRFVQRKS